MTAREDDTLKSGGMDQLPDKELPEDRTLFTFLEKEPGGFLPTDFPDRVLVRVERREFILDRFRQMGIIVVTVASIFLLLTVANLVMNVSLLDSLFDLLLNYLPYWTGLLLLLGLVQTADTLFIRVEVQ